MGNAKPALVFDFDGVIVDTCRLKDILFTPLETFDFSRQEIVRAYEKIKGEHGGQDPYEMTRRLAGDDHILQEELLRIWNKNKKRIVELISRHMLARIAVLKSRGFPLILLTAGHGNVQKEKVSDCNMTEGLEGMFDRIIYIEEDGKGENKIREMEELISEFGSLIALDDQPYNIAPFVEHDNIIPVFVRIFSDPRNADYLPPAGVPTVTSPDQLTPAFFTTLVSANTV